MIVLNTLGYIKKVTDYPIRYFLDDDEHLTFEMYSEQEIFKEIGSNRRNSTLNFPIKAFYRTKESEKERLLDGYFYQFENTHKVSIQTFIYCLSNADIGVVGFYIYSYLKHKNNSFKKGYDCPLEKLKVDTGIKKTTLCDYLKVLEEYNMIDNDHKPYVIDLKPGEQVLACTYTTKPYEYFIKNGEKKNVTVRQLITKKTYDENLEAQEKEQNEINPFIR
jgi:hypothetical protein